MGVLEGKRHLLFLLGRRAHQAKLVIDETRSFIQGVPKRRVIGTSFRLAGEICQLIADSIDHPKPVNLDELAAAHFPHFVDEPFCDVPRCTFPHNQPCRWCEATEGTTPEMHRDGRTYHRCNACGEPKI